MMCVNITIGPECIPHCPFDDLMFGGEQNRCTPIEYEIQIVKTVQMIKKISLEKNRFGLMMSPF